MSQDTQNLNAVKGEAPLQRFLNQRAPHDPTRTPDQNNHWQSLAQQAFTCRPKGCSKRGSSSPGGVGKHSTTKPKHQQRTQTSTSAGTNSTPVKKPTRLKDHCRCGTLAEAPYFERCEDCFAEDSERYSGADQSVILYW